MAGAVREGDRHDESDGQRADGEGAVTGGRGSKHGHQLVVGFLLLEPDEVEQETADSLEKISAWIVARRAPCSPRS